MTAYLFQSTLREFMRFKRLIVWIVVIILFAGIAMMWRGSVRDATPLDVYSQTVGSLVFRMMALAAAFFGTSIIGQEVEQRTIAYLITRPIPRYQIVVGRFFAASAVVAFLAIFGCLFVSFASFGPNFLNNKLLFNDLKAVLFGSAAYCGLFVFFSLISARSLVLCLIYTFGFETLTSSMPGEAYYLAILSYVQGIAQHPASNFGGGVLNVLAGQAGVNSIASSTGLAFLIMITAMMVALSSWWFTQFEYTPREDAE